MSAARTRTSTALRYGQVIRFSLGAESEAPSNTWDLLQAPSQRSLRSSASSSARTTTAGSSTMAELVPFDPRRVELGGPIGAPSQPPMFEGYPDVQAETGAPREYLAIVRRHWVLFGSIVSTVLAITVYFVLTAPPQFRATSVIRLADARRAMTGSAGSEVSDVIGRETDVILSQIQVLQSRQLAREVVMREGLRLSPAEGQPYIDELTAVTVSDSADADSVRLSFREADFSLTDGRQTVTGSYGARAELRGVSVVVSKRPQVASASFHVISTDAAIQLVLDQFRANPRPKTDIIDLTYVGGEPHYARRVANAMALTFQSYSGERTQAQSRRRRIFLEEQLKQTDIQLKGSMADYSNYRSGQQVFSSKEMASAQ